MIDELLSRQQNLETTRAELATKLASTRSALDDLTEPRNTDELLDHEVQAAALVAAITRVDTALEMVDKELSTAQEAQRRAELLDTIRDAAEAAVAATREEQRLYDDIALDLERIFGRILEAAEHGQAARRHLRGLLGAAAPALAVLGSPTTYSAGREAEAKELEAEMNVRGVDLRAALEPDVRLRYGSALLPLIDEWQLEQRLEVA